MISSGEFLIDKCLEMGSAKEEFSQTIDFDQIDFF